MRTINVVGLSCALVFVLQNFCLAQGCPHHPCGAVHTWFSDQGIQVGDIIREHLQYWYHMSRSTRFRVEAWDWDWMDCCETEYHHTDYYLDGIFHKWTGPGLVGYIFGSGVVWWPDSFTPEKVTITVTVDDYAYMLPCSCDAGYRDDRPHGKSIQVGAWQAGASMAVCGTHMSVPQTETAYEAEYLDYHYMPPYLDTLPKDIPISLDSDPISIGNYDDSTVISPNPQEVALSPAVVSQVDWTMFCVPGDDGNGGTPWNQDKSGFVGCTVDKEITGCIWSKVWDDDIDVFGGDVTVAVEFGAPPISIQISKTFNLAGDAARSQVAMGLGFQSDLPFQNAPYQGKFEHTDDSNWHSYSGTNPYIGSTSISAPFTGHLWYVARNGDLTASMHTKTEGWVKATEAWMMGQGGPVYWDAYGEVWEAGTVTYRIWTPYYTGERYPNPAW